MWILVVVVLTLSGGQVQEHTFRANDTFTTQQECTERGVEALAAFRERVPEFTGGAIVCAEQGRAVQQPSTGRSYEAL